MAGKKQALGKGLDALFGDIGAKVPVTKSDTEEIIITSGDTILYVDIDDIKPNSMQPRKTFKNEALEELADSIKTYGVIVPLLLQKAATGYELVNGERRWRAARKAGLKEVPAVVRELTEEENAMFAIIENLQREDLNTIEEATAFHQIIQRYGMTQESVAKAVGKSRPYIANTLRTLSMQLEIVDFLRQGDLTLGHANALGAVKDPGLQLQLAKKIVEDGLSVREAERLAALTEKKPAKKEPRVTKSVEIRTVEQELTSATGVRVKINGNGNKGRVELRYTDRQGLEEIIDLLRKAGPAAK